MATAYLSLGSNMDDRLVYLRKAVEELKESEGIGKVECSSVYVTDPVGYTDQAAFLNIACRILTSLQPGELLETCQTIENKLDRVRTVRWGPRTIDIDIVQYFDDSQRETVIDTILLTLPHPRAFERDFVQIPVEELKTGKRRETPGVKIFCDFKE